MTVDVKNRTVLVDSYLSAEDADQIVQRAEHIDGIALRTLPGTHTVAVLNQIFEGVGRDWALRMYPNHEDDIPHLGFLVGLPAVKRLEIGIHGLRNVDSLYNHPGLKTLTIGRPEHSLSLQFLEQHREIEELTIEGHFRDLDYVSQLVRLKSLVMRSVQVRSLGFLVGLKHLKTLRILLGSCVSLDAVSDIQNLALFELWAVRGVKLGTFKSGSIKYFELQGLPAVISTDWIASTPKVVGVWLERLRNLRSIDGIISSRTLEQLAIVDIKLPESEMRKLSKCTNLRQLLVPPMWGKENLEFLRSQLPDCSFDAWQHWTV